MHVTKAGNSQPSLCKAKNNVPSRFLNQYFAINITQQLAKVKGTYTQHFSIGLSVRAYN